MQGQKQLEDKKWIGLEDAYDIIVASCLGANSSVAVSSGHLNSSSLASNHAGLGIGIFFLDTFLAIEKVKLGLPLICHLDEHVVHNSLSLGDLGLQKSARGTSRVSLAVIANLGDAEQLELIFGQGVKGQIHFHGRERQKEFLRACGGRSQ